MSTISFGGLATGLDTENLINELIAIEKQPLQRLENDKTFYSNRLAAFTSFDDKLQALQETMAGLDTVVEASAYAATAASPDYFTATTTSGGQAGDYQIEVQQLAQVEKLVGGGYASKSDAAFGTGTLTLTVNGTATDIAYSGASLSDLMDAVNSADTGVSAAIINDGSTGYRLVLTGADSATTFSTAVSESVAGSYAPPTFSSTQQAQPAVIKVDGITIQSDSNTFTEAIPGVTLTVGKTNDTGVTTALSVAVDNDGMTQKIEAFVTAYNDVISFISDQTSASWGRDPAFRSVKNHLQQLVTTTVAGAGSLSALSQLGLSTQRDGTLSIDSSKLSDAIGSDAAAVATLLAGPTGTDGIADQFVSYLKGVTDTSDGMLALRQASTASVQKRLDRSIELMNVRLDQREKNLRAQFDALETLVSSLNSQSSYVSQQMDLLSNMWSQ